MKKSNLSTLLAFFVFVAIVSTPAVFAEKVKKIDGTTNVTTTTAGVQGATSGNATVESSKIKEAVDSSKPLKEEMYKDATDKNLKAEETKAGNTDDLVPEDEAQPEEMAPTNKKEPEKLNSAQPCPMMSNKDDKKTEK